MARNAINDNGVGPVQRTSRHFIQINSDVANVIAMAKESMSYIFALTFS
jgi:hypothetical protein